MKSEIRADIAIIGGGIIGLLTAHRLICAGKSVCVLDRSPTPQEASWAGAGVLMPLKPWSTEAIVHRLAQGAGEAYKNLSQQLEQQVSMDAGFGEGGVFFVQQSGPGFEDWASGQEQAGGGYWITDKQMRRLLGDLAPDSGDSQGFYLPGGCTLHTPKFCRALLCWLQRQAGFHLAAPCVVRSLQIEGGRVVGLQMDTGQMDTGQADTDWCRAEDYIVAAGAWSGQLVPQLHGLLAPVRGQILAYRTGCDAIPAAISGDDVYTVVRKDGLVLVGSTEERVGYDRRPTGNGYRQLQERGNRLMPVLKSLVPDYHWAGLRPGAARPLVGPMPGCANLWVNTGHFKEGIACAPASADLCASVLLGENPAVDLQPYLPFV